MEMGSDDTKPPVNNMMKIQHHSDICESTLRMTPNYKNAGPLSAICLILENLQNPGSTANSMVLPVWTSISKTVMSS